MYLSKQQLVIRKCRMSDGERRARPQAELGRGRSAIEDANPGGRR